MAKGANILLKRLADDPAEAKKKEMIKKGIFGPKRLLSQLPTISNKEDEEFNDMKQEDEEVRQYTREKERRKREKNLKKESLDNEKNITRKELRKHSTANDAWTSVDGVVYNIGAFVNRHSGGRIILKAAGKDGTKIFKENHNSSINVHKVLAPYKIGNLV